LLRVFEVCTSLAQRPPSIAMGPSTKMSYSNVESGAQEDILYEKDIEQLRSQAGWKRPARAGALVALLGTAGAALAWGQGSSSSGPVGGSLVREAQELIAMDRDLMLVTRKAACSKLWEQCGGEGHSGPTCCEGGSECEHFALESLPSYRQCRTPAPPACAAPEPGSLCLDKIQKSKAYAGEHPEVYHGLTGASDDREFQMFLHWAQKEESQCPEPCADGAGPDQCFFALHVEGCDTLDLWYCQHDDTSLKFACCCKFFHEETALDKPQSPDADMAKAMQAVGSDSPSLFCIAMCLPHGYELGLLRSQYAQGKLGLFDCNEWAIYSNESLVLSPESEKPVLKTALINGSLTADVGGNWGTALNTDVFVRFWDRVLEDEKAWRNDWIVKVDPDTMWLPVRLRTLLRTSHGPLGQPEPEKGFYLNNCHVGLHGPIEVLSQRAFKQYRSNKEACHHGKVSKIGQEDFFLDKCFEKIGITRVDAYNLMLEATLACQEVASAENPDRPPCFSPQVAFHPFKTTDTWMRCHQEAANHPWALPVIPVTDAPSEANNRHG